MGADFNQKNQVRELVVAPYNFSRFCEQPLVRYSGMDDLPGHDTLDPSLKSGDILVRMTAETPVMVTGPQKDAHKEFYRGPDGKCAIPGSTVKGLIRENMQILGFGFVRPGEDVYDERLYFRNLAGRNDDPVKRHYVKALGIKTVTIGQNPKNGKAIVTSDPQNVRSGYLVCEGKDQYSIYPLPQGENRGKCYILSRTKAGVTNLPALRKLALKPRGKKYLESKPFSEEEKKRIVKENERINNENSAKIIPVCYKTENGKVRDLKLDAQNQPGMKNGRLLVAGIPVGKDNAVYLFPEFVKEGEPIRLSDSDLVTYKDDLEARKISMPRDTKGNRKTLWDLPEKPGTYKPVFYLTDEENRVYFGMSRFLRIGYPHSIADGLPEAHKRNDEQEEATGKRSLDYPSAVLGFATDQQAYKSRVSFENLKLTGDERRQTLPPLVLAGPKPSFSAGYLLNKKKYIDDDFRLRGFKQYWLQASPGGAGSDKENVAVVLHPLAEGSCFKGSIRFKNLTEDELGLLLWSLLPKEAGDYRHSVGGAKPYGYGRMKLTIDRLTEYDTEDLYRADSLCRSGRDATAEIGKYLEAYRSYAEAKLQKDPLELPGVKEFLYMKKTVTDNRREVRYMSLDNREYQNNIGSLPTAEKYAENKKLERRNAT